MNEGMGETSVFVRTIVSVAMVSGTIVSVAIVSGTIPSPDIDVSALNAIWIKVLLL